jgi:DNA-directed RNA polymerase specialized sigma24 family protein
LRQHLEQRDLLAFWLYYRSGLSAKEISTIPDMHLTVKGVESLLLRAIRLLRRELFDARVTTENVDPSPSGEGLQQA